MSFRDVRDLSEHLKLLGYANVFPLQALSTNCGTLASFTIVSDILQWFADLLEPGTLLAGGTKSEEERVLLIRSAVEFFITKAAIKLNPRKLYSASAAAALELQKITSILIIPRDNESNEVDEENYLNQYQIDISDKMDNLRSARNLSSDLTKRAASLHELLTKEMNNKEIRANESNKPMEMIEVEKAISNAIAAAQVKLRTNRAHLENSKSEFNALSSKLQRKRTELERTKQRLDALQKIRPAHIQEFEECEKEISKLFQQYFLRLHVRDALLAQIEERAKLSIPAAMPIAAQKSNENSIPLLPEGLLDDDMDNEDASVDVEILGEHFQPDIRDEDLVRSKMNLEKHDNRGTVYTGRKRPGSASHKKRPTTGRSLMPGSQMGGGRTERHTVLNNYKTQEDNDDSSFGSESDLDIIDFIDRKTESGLLDKLEGHNVSVFGDDDDLNFNSIDEISISKITNELSLRPKTANKNEHQSDEDF